MKTAAWFLVPALAGVLGAGCGVDGTYRLTWSFTDNPGVVASAGGCGARGVESFRGTETRPGEQRSFLFLCAPGSLERGIPEGEWTVELVGIDARGNMPAPTEISPEGLPLLRGTSAPFSVHLGQPPAMVTVAVTPRPACVDGVDNDGDGAIDAADTGCLSGTAE